MLAGYSLTWLTNWTRWLLFQYLQATPSKDFITTVNKTYSTSQFFFTHVTD